MDIDDRWHITFNAVFSLLVPCVISDEPSGRPSLTYHASMSDHVHSVTL